MTVSQEALVKESGALKRPNHQSEKIKKPPTFCVILPVRNAQAKLAKRVADVTEVLENIQARTTIIVVNDGSSDQTTMVLQRLSLEFPSLIVIERAETKGFGSANRAGFRAAIDHGFDYALVLDGEIPANAESIEHFLRPMLLSYDFIKASRFSPYSQVDGVSILNRVLSALCNRLAGFALALPITDYSSGVRAIKCTLLARIMTEEKGPAVLIEEVVQSKRLGAKFFEVPFTRTDAGEGSLYSSNPSAGDYGRCLKHLFG